MPLRRIGAFLLAAATMHLAAVRADAACESHRATDARAAATSAETGAHHPGEHDLPAPGPSHEDACDDTEPAGCCEALVPCSIGGVEPAESDEVTLRRADARAAYPASVFLRSRIGAPDPPPPRS